MGQPKAEGLPTASYKEVCLHTTWRQRSLIKYASGSTTHRFRFRYSWACLLLYRHSIRIDLVGVDAPVASLKCTVGKERGPSTLAQRQPSCISVISFDASLLFIVSRYSAFQRNKRKQTNERFCLRRSIRFKRAEFDAKVPPRSVPGDGSTMRTSLRNRTSYLSKWFL